MTVDGFTVILPRHCHVGSAILRTQYTVGKKDAVATGLNKVDH